MSREHYETADHKFDEREVYKKLEEKWKCRIFALPISYHVDSVAVRGNQSEVESWLEVKCRTGKWDLYATYYIAALKWRAGVHLAQTTAKPFIIIFDWSGEIFFHVVNLAKLDQYVYRWGGRTKRTRDVADIEPMVHIPRVLFIRL